MACGRVLGGVLSVVVAVGMGPPVGGAYAALPVGSDGGECLGRLVLTTDKDRERFSEVPLPVGRCLVDMAGGSDFVVFVDSLGQPVVWVQDVGWVGPETDVAQRLEWRTPTFPPGVRVVEVDVHSDEVAYFRSDGVVTLVSRWFLGGPVDLRPTEDGVRYVNGPALYVQKLLLVRSDGAVDVVELDSKGVAAPSVTLRWPAPADARFVAVAGNSSQGVVLLDSLGRVWTHHRLSVEPYPVGPALGPGGARYVDVRVIGSVRIDDVDNQRSDSTHGTFLLRSDGVLEVLGFDLGLPERVDSVGDGYVALGTGEGWPVVFLDRGRAQTLGMATYWPAYPGRGWHPGWRVVPDGLHGWWFVQAGSMARGVVFGMVRAPKGVKSYSEVVDVAKGWYTAPNGRQTRRMYKGRDAVVLARVGTRGAVKGGVVRVLYKGKTIGKARVPASGLARIRIDTSRFSASGRKVKTNEVTVRFDGTATAKRSSPVVMSLNVFGAL